MQLRTEIACRFYLWDTPLVAVQEQLAVRRMEDGTLGVFAACDFCLLE